ncbi:MAG: hypothetical protein KGL39_38990 [Patescibacteria group bacterium]|nr:hypothetical protein [Patescibacteria group bacterium]
MAGFERRGELYVPRPGGKKILSYYEAEKIVWDIESSKVKPAGIILDSITGLVTAASYDVAHEDIPRGKIWSSRFSLATSQPNWGVMTTTIVLLNRVCRSMGIPFIMTAQEDERRDEASGKDMHFPQVNPAVRGDIIPMSDAVLRVSKSSSVFESAGKRFAAGDRVIRCQPNDEIYAKCRVPDDAPPAPDVIGNEIKDEKGQPVLNWQPALNRLWVATVLPLDTVVIYGRAGVGKTRLAVELVLYYAKKKASLKEKN